MTKFRIIKPKAPYEPPKITGPTPVGRPIFPGKTKGTVFLPEVSKNDLEVRIEKMQITADLTNNPGVRYMNLSTDLLPKAIAVTVKDQRGVVGFIKSALHFIGKKLIEAFQQPPWFGGPFTFMIFGRYLLSSPKNTGFGEEVIVRLNTYRQYQARREELESRSEEPLTVSFQGNAETSALNSFYVDEIVTRGESPALMGSQTIRVTTSAYAENLAPPDRSFLPGPLFVYPQSVEEVNGYHLRAGAEGEEIDVFIKTADRAIAEEMHQQVVEKYQSSGSAREAIEWLVHRSPWKSELFESREKRNPPPTLPPALTNILSQERPDLAAKVKQVQVNDLPPQVAELVKSLFEINKIDEFEHAGIAVKLADGTVFRHGGYLGGDITSWDPKQIQDNDAFQTARGTLIAQSKIQAGRRPDLFHQPVTLYYYHTHPYRRPTAFTETPIYEHGDQYTYTLTNESDAEAAEKYFDHMTKRLRNAGFTGPIELQAGAIPTRKGKADRLYVATFFIY